MQQRVFRRHGLERAVGMPEAVADGEQATPVVAGKGFVVSVEIGNVGEGRRQAILLRSPQAGADGKLDFAQALREGELLLVAKTLVVENEHRVTIHYRVDGSNIRRRQGLRQIDAIDLGCEAGADLGHAKAHEGLLPHGWRCGNSKFADLRCHLASVARRSPRPWEGRKVASPRPVTTGTLVPLKVAPPPQPSPARDVAGSRAWRRRSGARGLERRARERRGSSEFLHRLGAAPGKP